MILCLIKSTYLLVATLLGIDVRAIVQVAIDLQQDMGKSNPWRVNCFALITGLCLGAWAHLVADTLSSLSKQKKEASIVNRYFNRSTTP